MKKSLQIKIRNSLQSQQLLTDLFNKEDQLELMRTINEMIYYSRLDQKELTSLKEFLNFQIRDCENLYNLHEYVCETLYMMEE